MKLVLCIIVFLFTNPSQSREVISQDHPPELITEIKLLNLESVNTKEYTFYEATESIRSIMFNPNSLKYISDDKGNYYLQDSDIIVGQNVSLNLSEFEEPMILKINSVGKYFENKKIYTFSGIVNNDENSSFTFSVNQNTIVGNIKLDGKIFYMEPNDLFQGLLTLTVLNEHLIPKDSDDFLTTEKVKSKIIDMDPINNKSSGADGIINVYFYYGNNVSGVSFKIANFITDYNKVIENSKVSFNNRILNAGSQMVNNTFSTECKVGYLFDMFRADPPFTNIDSEISSNYADVGVLIAKGDNSLNCFPGYPGHVGGRAIIWDSTNPFMFIADNYLGSGADFSGIHELGHVLKGYHPDWFEVDVYNQGLINTSDPSKYWQSIMGSYHSDISEGPCLFDGTSNSICERVKYFTNPALTYNSDPLGSSVEDMESHLENFMPTASDWRGAPTGKSAVPSNFTVSGPECYGFYDLNWDSMANADEYHLYKSTHSNFSNPTIIYSGTSSTVNVNVTSGTWYFRIKAINAAGSSAYTSQKSATKVGYCM